MVVGHNNGVVGFTGFSYKRMCGLLFGPQKSGRNKGAVVWCGSTVKPLLSLPSVYMFPQVTQENKTWKGRSWKLCIKNFIP